MTTDEDFMRQALTVGARGLGTTAPNPSVGCVIVTAGQVVGRGWTQIGGRPHAETMALQAAGPLAKGATAYVTLEPCAHTGQTGPCAQALIDAGVVRVVSAIEDPDPRVQGRGHVLLRAAGVEVSVGACEAQAKAQNAGFMKRVRTGKPFVTLKVAASLDGRTALENGLSKWITGPEARNAGHLLRATHDAILTGSGTVLADDPQLDCRLPGMASRSPLRFVASTQGQLPKIAKLRNSPPGGVVYVLTAQAPVDDPGVKAIQVPQSPEGGLSIPAMLDAIGACGVTRLLVEAGPRLTTAFLKARLADQVIWFHGGTILGADAGPAIGPLGLTDLSRAPRFRRIESARWGDDVMETFAAEP